MLIQFSHHFEIQERKNKKEICMILAHAINTFDQGSSNSDCSALFLNVINQNESHCGNQFNPNILHTYP